MLKVYFCTIAVLMSHSSDKRKRLAPPSLLNLLIKVEENEERKINKETYGSLSKSPNISDFDHLYVTQFNINTPHHYILYFSFP